MKAFNTVLPAARSAAVAAFDTVLPPAPSLAPGGVAHMVLLDDPCCRTCGYPFAFRTDLVTQCGPCLVRAPRYTSARAALAYDDASRPMILGFKHGGHRDRLRIMVDQMARAGRLGLGRADVIIPVPLHYSRLVRRRYNPSAILGAALAKRAGVPQRADILLRARATPSQGGLSARARRANVRGAFTVRGAVAGLNCVLVDDVHTTGATLEACAKALLDVGAARVDCLTLARVIREDVTI